MSPQVGTDAEQTQHRPPPPPMQPDRVTAEPATVQACQADYAQAHKPQAR
jgi:hypothetical protein